VTFRPILLTAIVVGMAVSSCAAKESKTAEEGAKATA
jgi:multisubunit Na+/H+ antiporter MnhC subunit